MCRKEAYKRYIKRLRYKAFGILNFRCASCFSTDMFNLQFAHKKETGLNGTGRGQRQRFKDVIVHPDSYILLCSGCHRYYDNKEID